MRTMLTVGLVLAAAAGGVRAQQGADGWGKLATVNNLDVIGNTSFHLAMTFQLYDLNGKATERGTLEDWWAAPDSERVVVHLTGLNEDGSLAEGASQQLIRNRYLVNELLNLAVHPVPGELAADKVFKIEKETFGKLRVECLGPERLQGSEGRVQYESVCMQPQSDLVLIRRTLDENDILLRLSTGKFNDTHVALKLQLAYMGRIAIAGEVTKLQSFDAVKPEVQLLSLSLADRVMPNGAMHTGPAKGVGIGKSITREEPVLPNGHREGVAVVSLIFGKDGSVRDATPIACSDAQFCDAAAKAMAHWKNSPTLVNGQPVEVDITSSIHVTRESF